VPVLAHTLRRFEECASVAQTILVVPASEVASCQTFGDEHDLKKLARVVAGGETRTQSVWRGLQALDATTTEIVAVHDGVRPFVAPAEIDATVEAAREHGAAVLVNSVTDTIKEVNGGRIVRTLERESLRRALTPQCFRYDLLLRAYERTLAENFDATDDCALVERLGATVVAVEGDPRNIKLTRAEDFAFAELLLQGQSAISIQQSAKQEADRLITDS
jgi:2-C-methyl-D-erythritol 4-phosphate cytidylyltransferase